MKTFSILALVFGLVSAEAARAQCAPVTGPIPFSGSWIFTDGANFVGGDLPTFGMTPGLVRVTNFEVQGEWTGSSYSGVVNFRETGFFPGGSPYPYAAYPAGSGRPFGPFGRPGTVNLDGVITLSLKARDQILRAIESGLLKIPGVDRSMPNLNDVCVSDIAFNIGRWNGGFGGIVRGGSIYLYLNNTFATYEMRF